MGRVKLPKCLPKFSKPLNPTGKSADFADQNGISVLEKFISSFVIQVE